MKLEKIKCEPISGANRGITLSCNYVVCCRGTSVSVLERATLRLLKKVTHVDHVKKAVVSPDEKWVLIIACNDAFYVLSLEDFSVARYVIEGRLPCGNMIEGCWSFDGNGIYIPVVCSHAPSVRSSLRRYHFNGTLEKKLESVDLLKDKYYIKAITAARETEKYLLLGVDRTNNDQYTLISFDGNKFDEYPLPDVDCNVSMSSLECEGVTRRITLSGLLGLSETFEEADGQIRRLTPLVRAASSEPYCGELGAETIAAILSALKCERADVNEITLSSSGEFYYISSVKGLSVVDVASLKAVSCVRIKHGAQKTVEFGDRYIGVATLDGLRVYEIVRE